MLPHRKKSVKTREFSLPYVEVKRLHERVTYFYIQPLYLVSFRFKSNDRRCSYVKVVANFILRV